MWQWDRRVQGLLLLLAAALLFAGGARYGGWRREQGAVVIEAGASGSADTGAKQEELAVQVAGAVKAPGVYYFAKGTRVISAVEKAGALPQADLEALNLAQKLVDGEKIYVPTREETATAGNRAVMPQISQGQERAEPGNRSAGTGRLNVNTASAEELDRSLPGIGPTLAQRIVDYRNTHGPFRTVADLKNVSGIGERRYDQIKDLVEIQ